MIDRSAVRRNRWGLVAALLLVAYLGLLAVDAAPKGFIPNGDNLNLVRGTRVALDCVGRGEFRGCEAPGPELDALDRLDDGVGPYPLLQYLPAAVLTTLSSDDPQVVWWLGRVSWIAYGGLIVLLFVAGRALGSRVWRWLLPLVALVAPLPFYATAAFGEMLAAFVVLAAVTACLHRRPWLAAALVAAACLTKETAFPFVFVFAVIAARDPGDGLLPPRRMLVAITAGTAVGILATVLFNLFRFGGLENTTYLDPLWRTDGLMRQIDWLAAQVAAPAAGLLWFWLPVAVTAAAVLVIGIRRLVSSPRDVASWLPPLVSVGAFGFLLAGLAAWYSPFGFITWGPRLVVPFAPAAVVVMVKAGVPELSRAAETLVRHKAALVGVAVVAVVFAWPQLGAPWTWPQGIDALRETCPHLWDDRAGYFECAHIVTWRVRPSALWAASGGAGGPLVLGRILAGGAIVALLLQAHREVANGDGEARPESSTGSLVSSDDQEPATVASAPMGPSTSAGNPFAG